MGWATLPGSQEFEVSAKCGNTVLYFRLKVDERSDYKRQRKFPSNLKIMTSWQNYCDFIKAKNTCEEVMIISSSTGAHYAAAPPTFQLREYVGPVMTETGEEKDEMINEASDVSQLVKNAAAAGKGTISVPHGLRLNSGRKQMVIRTFLDEESGLPVLYGKYPKGGSCVASAGKVIVIGQFDENKNQTAAAMNETIQLMARYLATSVWPDDGGSGSTSSDLAKTWMPFCEQMLIGKGHIMECLIGDMRTGKIYACSSLELVAATKAGKAPPATAGPVFSLQKYQAEVAQEDGTDKLMPIDEIAAMTSLLSKPVGTRPPSGLRINQVKYQFLRGALDEVSDCNTIHGKKAKGGCLVSASKTVFIIATFDEKEGHTNAGCASAVADLAKYLKANGF